MPSYSELLERAASFSQRQTAQSTQSAEAHSFAGELKSYLGPTPFKRAQCVVMATQEALPHPSRILEVGSGLGIMTHLLASLGHRALGLEKDPLRLKNA